MKTGKGSKWYSRLVVTPQSYAVFLRMLTAPGNRRKLTKQTVEEKAEVCAVAVSMALELQKELPNCSREVDEWPGCN